MVGETVLGGGGGAAGSSLMPEEEELLMMERNPQDSILFRMRKKHLQEVRAGVGGRGKRGRACSAALRCNPKPHTLTSSLVLITFCCVWIITPQPPPPNFRPPNPLPLPLFLGLSVCLAGGQNQV